MCLNTILPNLYGYYYELDFSVQIFSLFNGQSTTTSGSDHFPITIKQAKSPSWRHYGSKTNSQTSITSVWKKNRKIKGKETTPKVHLKNNTNLLSDSKEQANYLAESFTKKLLFPKLF